MLAGARALAGDSLEVMPGCEGAVFEVSGHIKG
jgi:hypothetical protein